MFCAKFGGNWPSGSGQEDENVKSLQRDRQRTTGDQKSSLEPSSYPNFSLKKSIQLKIILTPYHKKRSSYQLFTKFRKASKMEVRPGTFFFKICRQNHRGSFYGLWFFYFQKKKYMVVIVKCPTTFI